MAQKKKQEHHGLMDRLIHGEHGHASKSEEAEVENDLPIESPKKKSSPKSNDRGDVKHQHKKFDKFKKGN